MPCYSQRATFPQHLAHRWIPRSLRRLCGAKYSYLGLLIYDYPVVTCSPVKILGLVVKLIHEQKKTKKHSLEIKESGRNHEHRASGSWLLVKAFDSDS